MIDMRDDRALASEIVAVVRNAVMKVERIPTHKMQSDTGLLPGDR